MRFSKITLLILGIGIFAIATAGLYTLYQEQLEEQENLNQGISVAQAILPGLFSEKGTLEDQLARLEDEMAQAEVRLSEVEAEFPESIQSIFYGDLLFSLAESLDLEVTGLTATKPAQMVDGNTSYEVTYFLVVVKGEVANILQYIVRIEVDDEFKTAGIEAVNTVIPVLLTDEEKEAIREAITDEKIEEFIREALAGLPTQGELTEEDLEAMIERLMVLIEELDRLAGDEVTALTAGEIEGLIIAAIMGVAERIAGEDIAGITEKLAELIGRLDSLKKLIEEEVAELVAEEIEELEMPSATINLRILSYEGQ